MSGNLEFFYPEDYESEHGRMLALMTAALWNYQDVLSEESGDKRLQRRASIYWYKEEFPKFVAAGYENSGLRALCREGEAALGEIKCYIEADDFSDLLPPCISTDDAPATPDDDHQE